LTRPAWPRHLTCATRVNRSVDQGQTSLGIAKRAISPPERCREWRRLEIGFVASKRRYMLLIPAAETANLATSRARGPVASR
jgi:hypothetical protein